MFSGSWHPTGIPCCVNVNVSLRVSVTLPHAWVNQQKEAFYFVNKSFSLYYLVYSEAVINVFIMSSTWLTVTMSASR